MSILVKKCPEFIEFLDFLCVGQQGDVLRGQRLHRQECDGVPDTPGQVRSKL